jgi:hypothetical protein
MKIFAVILVWMVVATEVMIKIAAFIFWTLAAGFFAWMLGGAVRDLYKHIRVKFVPVDQTHRHTA